MLSSLLLTAVATGFGAVPFAFAEASHTPVARSLQRRRGGTCSRRASA